MGPGFALLLCRPWALVKLLPTPLLNACTCLSFRCQVLPWDYLPSSLAGAAGHRSGKVARGLLPSRFEDCLQKQPRSKSTTKAACLKPARVLRVQVGTGGRRGGSCHGFSLVSALGYRQTVAGASGVSSPSKRKTEGCQTNAKVQPEATQPLGH